MSYRITGEHADAGASMAISVESAKTALIIARQWESEGRPAHQHHEPQWRGLRSLDQFGGIASVKEEEPDADRT